jgi:hypothetical protein
MNWQPIETAPKDGTRVMVFCPDRGVMEARFNQTYGRWGDPVYSEWDCEPTHWMPLPPAPEEET